MSSNDNVTSPKTHAEIPSDDKDSTSSETEPNTNQVQAVLERAGAENTGESRSCALTTNATEVNLPVLSRKIIIKDGLADESPPSYGDKVMYNYVVSLMDEGKTIIKSNAVDKPESSMLLSCSTPLGLIAAILNMRVMETSEIIRKGKAKAGPSCIPEDPPIQNTTATAQINESPTIQGPGEQQQDIIAEKMKEMTVQLVTKAIAEMGNRAFLSMRSLEAQITSTTEEIVAYVVSELNERFLVIEENLAVRPTETSSEIKILQDRLEELEARLHVPRFMGTVFIRGLEFSVGGLVILADKLTGVDAQKDHRRYLILQYSAASSIVLGMFMMICSETIERAIRTRYYIWFIILLIYIFFAALGFTK